VQNLLIKLPYSLYITNIVKILAIIPIFAYYFAHSSLLFALSFLFQVDPRADLMTILACANRAPLEGRHLKLDRIDRRILEAMQVNGRISNLELADAVGLSPTPCARRVKRLEESGLIQHHVTLLNQSMLGLKLTAYIGISMDRHTPDRFEAFEEKVTQFPEVMECSVVTGQSADYLLKAVVPDMEYYERFLLGKLTRIEGVTGVHSSFELRRVMQRSALPLEHIQS
jgi:Lrp/AsnC family transcriptional regulator, leucine-responsive regulatory protein